MSDDQVDTSFDPFESEPSDLPSDPENADDDAFMGAGADESVTKPPEGEEQVEAGGEEPEAEAGDDKEAEQKNPPATPPAKQLKFKVGDKEVDLDETASVEWKVDGKPTPVAIKDLLTNYAGKVAWEKRLNDVALERKQVRTEKETFSGERDRHRSLITDLHKKVGEGKMLEAVSSLVQMTGLKVDPREYVTQLRSKLIEQAQQLAAMSEEDRARHELNEEREYLRAQQQSWQQRLQAEQAKKAFEQRVATVIQKSGMSEDEFAETYGWIKERVAGSGGDPNQVTPEYVAEHKATKQAYETARDAIAAVEPDLIDGHVVKDEAKWDRLAALAKAHPEFTAEEFAEMYRETRKSKLANSVSKKVNKAPTRTAATAAIKAKPKPQRNSMNEAFTEADFEW
jgi:hypothetical protein